MRPQLLIKSTLLIVCVLLAGGGANASAQSIFDKYKNKVQEKLNEAQKKAEEKTKSETEANVNTAQTKGDKKIWGFVSTTVSVKKGFKTFLRVYVSEITEVPLDEFKKFNSDSQAFKSRVREYFAATVIAGAKEHGEQISEPDDYSNIGIVYKFSAESYTKEDFYTNAYRYNDKSVLDAPFKEQVDYAQSAGRPLFYFRWDPAGKNVQSDLEAERKRTSGELPVKQ